MGQSTSTPISTTSNPYPHLLQNVSTRRRSFAKSTVSAAFPFPPPPPNSGTSKDEIFGLMDLVCDVTADLPDECLALVFHSLSPGDRKSCSLVCKRWLVVEGQSRQRISVDARAALLEVAPAIFKRFDSITKLALKCNRRTESIGDEALNLISLRCPHLTRLKLRACREVTDFGMIDFANNCKSLKKLSCGSCTFGVKGISAVVSSCSLLEELSIRRLRGLNDGGDPIVVPKNSALRSICLKEIYNGQLFVPYLAGSPKLKTLKLFRCLGDWDRLLEEIAGKTPALIEVHLEKIQISDRGISAFTSCLELEIFHLVKTLHCTDFGISTVAQKCRLLRKIRIDGWKGNMIGDEGLSAVAQNCGNLQELVLIGINPTLVSIELIANNCKRLERLALCASETIGDAEISCIASKCDSLKKLCIKSCQVSNQGMKALATGCPKLVKVKVKKCREVTVEAVDWLRASREDLAVNLDIVSQADASASECGIQENGDDQLLVMVEENSTSEAPLSNSRSVLSKARHRIVSGRNFLASTFRKLSHSSSNERHS